MHIGIYVSLILYHDLLQYGEMRVSTQLERTQDLSYGMKKDCKKIEDFYKDNNLMSFAEIVAQFDIPKKHFFKFIQFRSYVSSHEGTKLTKPIKSHLKTYYKNLLNLKV